MGATGSGPGLHSLVFTSSLTQKNNEKWYFGIFIVEKNLLTNLEFTFNIQTSQSSLSFSAVEIKSNQTLRNSTGAPALLHWVRAVVLVEQGQVCHQQVWGEERAWWSPDTGHMQAHWTDTNSPTDPCQATLPDVELYKLWEYDWVNLRLSSSTLHHCNEAWEVTNSRPRQWNTLHQPNIPRNSSRSTAELSQMILLEYFQSGGQSGTIRHPAHLACLLRPEREENLSYCFIFSCLSISLRWWNIFEIFSTEQNPQTWHRERQSVLSD